jgi:phage shock protein PspC (stress-responsive transcriptional regulator)
VRTENLHDLTGLRRSVTDRKIAGVAGGLGRHLNIDPTIFRVAFVVLCFFGLAGFVLYGAAWLLVPVEGSDRAVVSTSAATRTVLLVVAAAAALLLVLGDTWGRFRYPWPLLVLVLVAFLILMNRDKLVSTQDKTAPHAADSSDSLDVGGGASAAQGPADQAYLPSYPPNEPGGPGYPPPGTTAQGYVPPAPAAARGPHLFGITIALVAIALGVLGLFDVAGASVVDAAYPALALTVIGVMLLVGAWVGRAGGLIALGLVATVALLVTSATVPRFQGARQVTFSPDSAAQVQSLYTVPAGSIDLDLSHVRDLQALDGRTIMVKANAGDLVVTLPPGVDTNVSADISVAGEADVAGQVSSGTNVHVTRVVDGGTAVPRMNLNLDLVVGNIEVRQS